MSEQFNDVARIHPATAPPSLLEQVRIDPDGRFLEAPLDTQQMVRLYLWRATAAQPAHATPPMRQDCQSIGQGLPRRPLHSEQYPTVALLAGERFGLQLEAPVSAHRPTWGKPTPIPQHKRVQSHSALAQAYPTLDNMLLDGLYRINGSQVSRSVLAMLVRLDTHPQTIAQADSQEGYTEHAKDFTKIPDRPDHIVGRIDRRSAHLRNTQAQHTRQRDPWIFSPHMGKTLLEIIVLRMRYFRLGNDITLTPFAASDNPFRHPHCDQLGATLIPAVPAWHSSPIDAISLPPAVAKKGPQTIDTKAIAAFRIALTPLVNPAKL